ncbi:MAG TPA: chemotaxis protein CheW [Noviherbaspirillum sp.]|uniref:chemotaxis protein CheW n=1 Tax=Noviherbaspirillum sp. TaxID=1926288 RepID=UPI002B45C70F|nr:chemotaxis protein CheW [Noviherbaspirillum sp.]HJV86086.1 chemotaxis protein CheW [Noviherbaspirillum sp.]
MSSLVEARANAKRPIQAGADHAQYLTFMLGGETFAIGILAIKEIIEYGGLTDVPMMPECIRGVINLRGAVVPVVDLSARFGRATTAITKRTCIVIVEVSHHDGQQVIGVVVDAVNAVLEIPAAEIEPPPTFGAKIRTEFIEGMGKVNGRFVILLNVDSVLSVEDRGALASLSTDTATI